MYFPRATPLPTLDDMHRELPLSAGEAIRISSYRQKIENKIQGAPGFILIVGPCSIHNVDGAIEYGKRLVELQKELGNAFFIVMRTFLEKPRSWGGWKGFIMDPTVAQPPDPIQGIYESRRLLLELTKLGLPLATEFLHPLLAPYTADLITWGCIGARTSSSQIHRELASMLPIPIGFKNGLDGHYDLALQGILTARQKQWAVFPSRQGQVQMVETPGNPHTHLVLRGGYDGPNFDDLDKVEHRLLELDLEPKIIIDCSHDNSKRDLEKQKENCEKVIGRYLRGEKRILGAMVESYLDRGKGQSPTLSMTDPCLGWEETEELILRSVQ